VEPFHPGVPSPLEGADNLDRRLVTDAPIVLGAQEIDGIRQLRVKQAYLDNWRKYSDEERRGVIADRERWVPALRLRAVSPLPLRARLTLLLTLAPHTLAPLPSTRSGG
jgi:hypothetical protein